MINSTLTALKWLSFNFTAKIGFFLEKGLSLQFICKNKDAHPLEYAG